MRMVGVSLRIGCSFKGRAGANAFRIEIVAIVWTEVLRVRGRELLAIWQLHHRTVVRVEHVERQGGDVVDPVQFVVPVQVVGIGGVFVGGVEPVVQMIDRLSTLAADQPTAPAAPDTTVVSPAFGWQSSRKPK